MAWTQEMIQRVWEKGIPVNGQIPADWRKDQCGAWMSRGHFGDRNSQYGWEIDHIAPSGPDVLGNLRLLQWENNVGRSDGPLKCNVTASGFDNVKTR